MAVERRQRITGGYYLGSPHDCAREAKERFWHFQHDLAAAFADRGNVADELQGIPEPLLGVDQDGFSVEKFAGP